jgi:ATP-citrate lyase beta-subunit
VIQNKTHEAESIIATLNERSQASFALTVLREDAPIYTLLSGGGASLVTLDVLVDAQLQDSIGNYGEYSGAPTREETEQYTNAILSLLMASSAPRKVLIVAGGVANFTDISITFSGIVDALTEHLGELQKQDILILVRRGGPRHTKGLAHLESFCTEHGLSHIIAGPEKPLPSLALDTKQYLNTN